MHPKALVAACAELVEQNLKFEHPADAVVARFFREHRSLGPRERLTLAEAVFMVLRKRLLFEHFAVWGSGAKARRLAILGLARSLAAGSSPASGASTRSSREFLRAGLSDVECQWLDRCEQVNEADLFERHRHNLPEWLAQALKAQLGSEFWSLVAALDQSAALDLRVNTYLAKRDEVLSELAADGLVATPTPYSPWGLRLPDKTALSQRAVFTRGAVEIQDEGSQLLALLADAKRGEMVADFCAGAGGKTLALGAAMRNTGRLYAFDTSGHRLESLKGRLARSQLSNVHPVVIAHERDERLRRLTGKFDRVLVDAPCSGLGTLRRNPDLKWRQTEESISEFAAKQTEILAAAARLLKPGGRLVYGTCSILDQENEQVAQEFGASHSAFVPINVADTLSALKVSNAESICSGAPSANFLRLWPHRHGTDGFFAAVWVRMSN